MLHIYLDGQYYKSVNALYQIELEIGNKIQSLQFAHNRRVYITLTDDVMAEDYLKAA